ncbi:MAG: hypothetical protein ABI895_37960 [Deltaproteobacteria bacterium]
MSGRLTTLEGDALPGVLVNIKGHPELGQTFSRADGHYDLVVNGGGALMLAYGKPGFLPLQRLIQVGWGDFIEVEAVAATALDTQVTQIDFSAGELVAESSVSLDDDGVRQASLIFQQGTQAVMHLPDGSSQPLDSMGVRLAEYTVGPNGPAAMPAPLPATSGYTYAAELSADEAIAAGATSVTFDRPAAFYLDNFLGFPVGTPVPVGFYDPDRTVWVGSDDGVVVEVLDVAGGLASLDVDGTSNPATPAQLSLLGITEAELEELAQRFAPGQSLWRVQVEHFSTMDCNWPSGPPDDADDPGSGGGGAGGGGSGDDPGPEDESDTDSGKCEESGSQIHVDGQSLGETLPIAGTPYALKYNSRLVPGYADKRDFRINLTRSSVPASLLRVELELSFQGQRQVLLFPAAPNLQYAGIWDGIDKYGRQTNRAGAAEFKITYVYPTRYRTSIGQLNLVEARSWALASGNTLVNLPTRVAASEAKLSRTWKKGVGSRAPELEARDARGSGLGGWTLDVHHVYDPARRAILLGSGSIRSQVGSFGPSSKRIAGGTSCGHGSPTSQADTACCTASAGVFAPQTCLGDGAPAAGGYVGMIVGAQSMPDGSVLFTSLGDFKRVNELGSTRLALRRVARDGILHTVRPTLPNVTWGGNGGYNRPGAPIALGADGSVYVGSHSGIMRAVFVSPDVANLTRVAGGGPFGSADQIGVLATSIDAPVQGLAVGADGTVFTTLYANSNTGGILHVVRGIGTDGIIRNIAGTGVAGFSGDEGPALEAQLYAPMGLGVGPDGSLYIAEASNGRIRRVTPDGIIHTVAGNGAASGTRTTGDGGPATQAFLNEPQGVAPAADGSLYLLLGSSGRYVAADGIIRTVWIDLVSSGAINPFDAAPAQPLNLKLVGQRLIQRQCGVGVHPVPLAPWRAAQFLPSCGRLRPADGFLDTTGTSPPPRLRAAGSYNRCRALISK